MRKAIFIFLFVALSAVKCLAQTNKPVETVLREPLEIPADSLPVISLKDMNLFYQYMRENIVVSEYEKMNPQQVLNLFMNWAIVQWNNRKKKP